MADHITQPVPGVQALDYEAVKDYFFAKLECDRHGRGRMESALYHTAQWIFEQGCAQHQWLRERMDSARMWISVNDRLPDDLTTVLAAFKAGEATTAYVEGGQWFDRSTGMSLWRDPVTHWRHLPEPPHA